MEIMIIILLSLATTFSYLYLVSKLMMTPFNEFLKWAFCDDEIVAIYYLIMSLFMVITFFILFLIIDKIIFW